jgi:glucosamine-6-phosphate deaminase
MPKNLGRTIALLLIPCLVAAQSPESRFQLSKPRILSTELFELNGGMFTSQALAVPDHIATQHVGDGVAAVLNLAMESFLNPNYAPITHPPEHLYRPDLIVVQDKNEMSRRAFEEVQSQIKAKADSVFLFPTGETPKEFYRLLADAANKGEINLRETTIFMLDEYEGGMDYHEFIHEYFLNYLTTGNRPKNVLVLDGMTDNWEKETMAYEKKIKAVGGIDLCLLGVGPEGHIGFNEKGSAFDSRTRRIELAPSTIDQNRKSMKRLYTRALTVGIGTILESRRLVVIANGGKKAKPIERLFSENPSTDLPLSALWYHSRVKVIVDRDAAPPQATLPKYESLSPTPGFVSHAYVARVSELLSEPDPVHTAVNKLSGKVIHDKNGQSYLLRTAYDVRGWEYVAVDAPTAVPIGKKQWEMLSAFAPYIVKDRTVAFFVFPNRSLPLTGSLSGDPFGTQYAQLYGMVVLPAFQRRGITSAVVQAWSKDIPPGETISIYSIHQTKTDEILKNDGRFTESPMGEAFANTGLEYVDKVLTPSGDGWGYYSVIMRKKVSATEPKRETSVVGTMPSGRPAKSTSLDRRSRILSKGRSDIFFPAIFPEIEQEYDLFLSSLWGYIDVRYKDGRMRRRTKQPPAATAATESSVKLGGRVFTRFQEYQNTTKVGDSSGKYWFLRLGKANVDLAKRLNQKIEKSAFLQKHLPKLLIGKSYVLAESMPGDNLEDVLSILNEREIRSLGQQAHEIFSFLEEPDETGRGIFFYDNITKGQYLVELIDGKAILYFVDIGAEGQIPQKSSNRLTSQYFFLDSLYRKTRSYTSRHIDKSPPTEEEIISFFEMPSIMPADAAAFRAQSNAATWFEEAVVTMSGSPILSDFMGNPELARETIKVIRLVLGDEAARVYLNFWLQFTRPPDETFRLYAESIKSLLQDVKNILPLMEQLIIDPRIGGLLRSTCHEVYTFLMFTVNAVEAMTGKNVMGSLRKKADSLANRLGQRIEEIKISEEGTPRTATARSA